MNGVTSMSKTWNSIFILLFILFREKEGKLQKLLDE